MAVTYVIFYRRICCFDSALDELMTCDWRQCLSHRSYTEWGFSLFLSKYLWRIYKWKHELEHINWILSVSNFICTCKLFLMCIYMNFKQHTLAIWIWIEQKYPLLITYVIFFLNMCQKKNTQVIGHCILYIQFFHSIYLVCIMFVCLLVCNCCDGCMEVRDDLGVGSLLLPCRFQGSNLFHQAW